MTDHEKNGGLDRRGFFKTAGAGLSAAGLVLTGNEAAAAAAPAEWSEKDKLARIASCSYPIRYIFKSRTGGGRGAGGRGGAPNPAAGRRPGRRWRRPGQCRHDERADEGEVRRDHHARLPAVHEGHVPRRDPHGSLLGAVRRRDRRQHVPRPAARLRSDEPVGPEVAGQAGREHGDDRRQVPAHLEQRAVEPGGSPDEALRERAGVDDRQEVARRVRRARREVDADELAAGARARASGRTRFRESATATRATSTSSRCSTPRSSRTRRWRTSAASSAIKVTFENHWGLAADPMNIRIMIDTINHPVLRGVARLLQLGARVHALQRPQGARAVLAHERAREVLGSLGGQERRAALGRGSCSPAGSRAPSRSSTRRGR